MRRRRALSSLDGHRQFKKPPDVTRKRLRPETMERVSGSADKIIVDSNVGVVPYLSLRPLQERKMAATVSLSR